MTVTSCFLTGQGANCSRRRSEDGFSDLKMEMRQVTGTFYVPGTALTTVWVGTVAFCE